MGRKRPRSKKPEQTLPMPVVNSPTDDDVNYHRKEWWEYDEDVTKELGPRIAWTKVSETQVSAQKKVAYMSTDYVVFAGSRRFTMRVDEYSPDLKALLQETKKICGAFLTAYNPHGELRDKDTNEAANARLLKHLKAREPLGALVYSGKGEDPTGEWSPEPSFLVLGIDLVAARQIGEQFKQDAMIYFDDDAIPELVLLR